MILADYPIEERAVSLHEASHAVLAEVLQWPVLAVRIAGGGRGVCNLRTKSVPTWLDAVVASAGHAAERYYIGRVVDEPSASDRREAARDFRSKGVGRWSAPWAVIELERELWPLFEQEEIADAVRNVAEELVQTRLLNRRQFLDAARPALRDAALARLVRRFCKRLAVRVLESHLGGER